MVRPNVADGKGGPHIWRVAADIRNKQPTSRGATTWGVRQEVNYLSLKKKKSQYVTQYYTGPRYGCCEDGNEPSDSIKGREYLNQLSDYQFLKEDSVLWSSTYMPL